MFVGHDLSLGAKHTLDLDESVKYRPSNGIVSYNVSGHTETHLRGIICLAI